jgi:hypothetical protein
MLLRRLQKFVVRDGIRLAKLELFRQAIIRPITPSKKQKEKKI